MITWIADHAGLTGLLIFFGFFVGMLLWLYGPGRKQQFEPLANIPFDEDES